MSEIVNYSNNVKEEYSGCVGHVTVLFPHFSQFMCSLIFLCVLVCTFCGASNRKWQNKHED